MSAAIGRVGDRVHKGRDKATDQRDLQRPLGSRGRMASMAECSGFESCAPPRGNFSPLNPDALYRSEDDAPAPGPNIAAPSSRTAADSQSVERSR